MILTNTKPIQWNAFFAASEPGEVRVFSLENKIH